MTMPATLIVALDAFVAAETCRGYVDSEATNRMERDQNLRAVEAAIERYVEERVQRDREERQRGEGDRMAQALKAGASA